MSFATEWNTVMSRVLEDINSRMQTSTLSISHKKEIIERLIKLIEYHHKRRMYFASIKNY